MAQWGVPLESNPEALNKFLRKLDVPEPTQCVDVYGFDEELLNMVPKPVYALIFVFPDFTKFKSAFSPKYDKLKDAGQDKPEGLFFMKQHIKNACGTFAVCHALANNSNRIDLGKGSFQDFLSRAKNASSEERSKLLEEDKKMLEAHSNCADSGDTEAPARVEHHFICFLQKDGQLWEFDSGAPFPRAHGKSSEDTFLRDVAKVIKDEFLPVCPDNISFSALALVGAAPQE